VFRSILSALVIFAIAASSLAATPAKSKKKRHPLTTATTTASHKHTAKSAAAATTSVKTVKASARHKGKVVKRPVRSYQQAPTTDRYREIQQALASKGYFKAEPTGEWGADSADALKRFQADQSLMPDGKINSLSLIALGLGPKRLTAKSDTAPPATPPVAAPTPTSPPQ
jgi:peptidoglycan hydrolase-like protein with peptidoglycan-binding domain